MALTPFQLAECLREVGTFMQELRPPKEIRDKLDYSMDIRGSEVILSSVRSHYDGSPGKNQFPVAKAKWVATRKEWQLYWQRADCKWHVYDAGRQLRTIREALAEVRRDPHCCFFG